MYKEFETLSPGLIITQVISLLIFVTLVYFIFRFIKLINKYIKLKIIHLQQKIDMNKIDHSGKSNQNTD